MSDAMRLEQVVLDLIHHGRSRCGPGFGKYPLGVEHSIEQLLPLCNASDPLYRDIENAWEAFKERLSR